MTNRAESLDKKKEKQAVCKIDIAEQGIQLFHTEKMPYMVGQHCKNTKY